jgi:hypothetical protein
VGFLTPIAKAYGSDLSFRVTETAMQVYGGYGYMRDYPIEQFLRDEKVHSIFEGTNGIQALDLAARKLGRESESLFKFYLEDIRLFCKTQRRHKTLARFIEILEEAGNALSDVSSFLLHSQKKDFSLLALYAYPYLELFGDVTVGWLLMQQAVIAQEKLDCLMQEKGLSNPTKIADFIEADKNAAFYSGKLASARYFLSSVVGLAPAKAQAIKTADRAALEISENGF